MEAQACGTPVIAYGRGGARETVLPGKTGLFFNEQTSESLRAAIDEFEENPDRFDPKVIRTHAEKFSSQIFRDRLKREVTCRWQEFVSQGI